MGEVVSIGGLTRLNLDADSTLENLKGTLEGFVLSGYDKDGNEFFSSTYGDDHTILWLLERMKINLLLDESE